MERFELGETYMVMKDMTLWGLFSAVDLYRGNVIVIREGDREDTFTAECGPCCFVEIWKDHNNSAFELCE